LEDGVVEELAAAQHADDADAGEQQDAEGDHLVDDPFRHDALGRGHAEYDGVQDDARRADDPGLEAAARTIVAVKLHIEPEHQSEGQEQLGGYAQQQIALHGASPPSRALRLRRRPPISSSTPMPAVKITVVSPSVSKPR